MRKITNNFNLPKPLYNALAANTYVGGGDISVTRLIAPPRQVVLRRFHEDEITEDATDRIWSLLGSSVHRMIELSTGDKYARALSYLEEANTLIKFGDYDLNEEEALIEATSLIGKAKDVILKVDPSPKKEHLIVEKRYSMPIKGILVNENSISTRARLEWNLSGQLDVDQEGHIYDFKVTSVFSANKEKIEWEQQLNLQAMLSRHNGQTVKSVSIIAILRDWQQSKAKLEESYPQVACKVISFPLWTQEQAISFAEERMKIHQQAFFDYEKTKDVNVLPLCSDEERWYAGTKYAVYKSKDKDGSMNKRATKVFTTKAAAMTFMQEQAPFLNKGKSWAPLVERMGRNVKCLSYCDLAKEHCPFGMALLGKVEPEEDEDDSQVSGED